MQYYVIGADGNEYGPADIATLNIWITESRILPTTQLRDAASGQVMAASQVQGINFSGAAPLYAPIIPAAAQPAQPLGQTTSIPTGQPGGNLLNQPAAAPLDQAAGPGAATGSQEPVRVGSEMHCPKCNAFLATGTLACGQCGQKFMYPVALSTLSGQGGTPGPAGGYYAPVPGWAPQGAAFGAVENNSGQNGPLPPAIAAFRWNWGAFFLAEFWFFFNGAVGLGAAMWLLVVLSATLGLVAKPLQPLVSLAGLALRIYAGSQGHKIAWQRRRFESFDQYLTVQRAWMRWGVAIFIVGAAIVLLMVIFIGAMVASGGIHPAAPTGMLGL